MPHTSRLIVAALMLLSPARAAVAAAAAPDGTVHPVVPAYERFHAAAADPSAAGGQLLLTELSCTACHAAPAGADLAAKGGPVLNGIGGRASADWLRAFLTDPQAAKPGTTMPDPLAGFAGQERAGAVEALVHLLATSPDPLPKPEKLPTFASAGRGATLYHEVGCVACHAPDPLYRGVGDGGGDGAAAPPAATRPAAGATVPPVPLPDLRRKYTLASLSDFLRRPLDHRPAGRMPDLLLDKQEATDLAAHLVGWDDVKTAGGGPASARVTKDPALLAKGLKLFEAARCASCHTLAGTKPAAGTKPLTALPARLVGCLSPTPPPTVPAYRLSDAQRAAVLLALGNPGAGTDRAGEQPAAAARVAATMERLNCYACHDRDGRGGPTADREGYFTGDHDLGNEGRFPPRLTGVGRKLTRGWLDKVLLGREGRVRPYVRTRMPVYPAAAAGHLPADLIAADSGTKADPKQAFAGGDAEAGRKLLGASGLSCITCHGLRGREATGIRAADITAAPDRLQPGWFKANLLDPAGLRPGTLMPSFWPEGRGVNTEILGGDADRQVAAIWAFLRDGKGEPDGYPPPKGEFELVAQDRPVLLRCFMKGAGTHAIAVGFPDRVHVAFDADAVRPALAWRRKFLDAYSTWFSRAQPPVDPLGADVVALPPGVPLARLDRPDAPWPAATGVADAGYRFGGYRLDRQGVPTFLYRVGDTEVEDRLVPLEGGKGLARTLVLRGGGAGLYFRPGSAAGVTVTLHEPQTDPAAGPLPVRFENGVSTLKVEYRW